MKKGSVDSSQQLVGYAWLDGLIAMGIFIGIAVFSIVVIGILNILYPCKEFLIIIGVIAILMLIMIAITFLFLTDKCVLSKTGIVIVRKLFKNKYISLDKVKSFTVFLICGKPERLIGLDKKYDMYEKCNKKQLFNFSYNKKNAEKIKQILPCELLKDNYKYLQENFEEDNTLDENMSDMKKHYTLRNIKKIYMLFLIIAYIFAMCSRLFDLYIITFTMLFIAMIFLSVAIYMAIKGCLNFIQYNGYMLKHLNNKLLWEDCYITICTAPKSLICKKDTLFIIFADRGI